MEMMVNNKENVRKYPQIAEAFEVYAGSDVYDGKFPRQGAYEGYPY